MLGWVFRKFWVGGCQTTPPASTCTFCLAHFHWVSPPLPCPVGVGHFGGCLGRPNALEETFFAFFAFFAFAFTGIYGIATCALRLHPARNTYSLQQKVRSMLSNVRRRAIHFAEPTTNWWALLSAGLEIWVSPLSVLPWVLVMLVILGRICR